MEKPLIISPALLMRLGMPGDVLFRHERLLDLAEGLQHRLLEVREGFPFVTLRDAGVRDIGSSTSQRGGANGRRTDLHL